MSDDEFDTHSLDNWLSEQLDFLAARNLLRPRTVTTTLPEGRCEHDGEEFANFASNDYLGLSHDPRVVQAFKDAAGERVGASASALICGRSQIHGALEERIAEFEGAEAAVLFPSGYAANQGTLLCLMNSEDVVFCDRLNHASLIDGCRASRAKFEIYPHCDVVKLEQRIRKAEGHGRRFIVTDGVFSMDGTIAPLPALCELAEHHGCTLIVDEAHGTGVLGKNGRGACEFHNVEERVHIRMGTLSKSVGAVGGFVVGSNQLVDWLWNSARTQFFSTALPPAVCAAAMESFDIMANEPERRETLAEVCRQFRSELAGVDIEAGGEENTPIVPIIVGNDKAVMESAARLKEAGFLVGAIRPPTVPHGTARLRVSLSAVHSPIDIASLAQELAEVVERQEV